MENHPKGISDAPALQWRILNEETQIARKDGQLVAIAYTIQASDTTGRGWLEFGWIPIDDPELVDVHFGVAPGTGSAWDTRLGKSPHARRSGA